MKKLLSLSMAFVLAVFSLSANEKEKLSAIDSMAVRVVKNPMLWDYFKSSVSGFEKLTPQKKLLIEYDAFRICSDAMREEFKDVPAEILQNAFRTMDMPLIRFFYSKEFYKDYISLLSEALKFELAGNQGFSYTVRYEQAPQLAQVLQTAMKPLLDVYAIKFRTMLPKNRKSEDEQLVMAQAVPRVLRRLPDLMVKVLSEYFDLEDLLKMYSDPQLATGLTYALNRAVSSSMRSGKRVSLPAAPGAAGEAADTVATEELIRYVGMARSVKPMYFPLYRHQITIKGKKYEYVGDGRFGVPYGKGLMTDKKGVTYKGDFKNGRRHGLVEVTKPGSDPILQVWADDRYMKKLRVGPDGEEQAPEAATYLDMLFGYGKAMGSGKVLLEGFFVDGELHGRGKRFTDKNSMIGEFEYGVFRSGVMRYFNPKWKEYELRGRKCGDDFVGYRKKVSRDGSYQETATGVFNGDVLDGKHTVRITSSEGIYSKDGFFAYGDMYGFGKMSSEEVDPENNIRIADTYQGYIARNMAHGEGVAEIKMTQVPQREWMFKIYSVKVDGFPSEKDASIRMQGRFEYGRFVDGRVEASNGIVMTGTFRDEELYDGVFVRNCPDGTRHEIKCIKGRLQNKGLIHLADGTYHESDFDEGKPVVKKPVAPEPPVDKNVRYVDHSSNQDVIRTFEYNNMPVKKGVVRVIRPAGVKIMIRGKSSINVVCTGTFDGEILLKGKVTMSDGNWLEGTFEDGILIKGRGKTVDKYGTVYVGEIRNGYPHGNGRCTYSNGTWFKGRFYNGSRMQGTHYSADGKVLKEYK